MTISGDSNPRARPMPVAAPEPEQAPNMTLALATQMLPLVSRIVADLRTSWESWRAAVNRYDEVMAALDSDMHSTIALEAQRHVRRCASDVDALRRELEPLGATCRSPRTGRVEWPAVTDATAVRLLWQPGESAVTRFESAGRVSELIVDDSDDTDPSRS